MTQAAAIIGSLFIYWAVAFFTSRRANETREEFAVSTRSLGSVLIAAGLSMTFVGGAATVTMSSLGYRYGLQALIDPASVLVGLTIATLLVHKYRADRFVTITESLSGESTGLLRFTSVVAITFYLLLMAANVAAFTKLVTPYFNVPEYLIALIGTCITASYTLRSGIMSVTKTDLVQLFAVLLLFVAPCIYLMTGSAFPAAAAPVTINDMPINTMVILSFTALLCPVLQDVKLRAQAARTEGAARAGIFTAAVLYVIIVGAAVLTGLAMARAGIAVSDPETVLAVAFDKAFGEWGVIFIIGVLAAILSTLDGFALSAITTVQAIPWSPLGRSKAPVWVGAVLFAAAFAIAVVLPQVLSLVLLALLLYVSVLLPIAIGRYLRVADSYLLAAGVAFAVAASLAYFLSWQPIPFAIMFPLGHLLLVLIAYLISRRSEARPSGEGR